MFKFIKFLRQFFLFTILWLCPGCFVDSVCYSDADCPARESCNPATGACVHWECQRNPDCDENLICDLNTHECIRPECLNDDGCAAGYECLNNSCRALSTLYCPSDMVPVNRSFCIDRYEASKPDATVTSGGGDTTKAVSRSGVMPWTVADNATAQAACVASGKALCDETQWQVACEGPDKTTYAYGDAYESATCNGIDTFCLCDSCAADKTCSYPYCFGECGAALRLMPTGSFPNCANRYGVFDMNGNLWEHVLNGNDMTVRGGAYNCKDSRLLHQCGYIPGNWTPSARGFRCCSAGSLVPYESDTDTATDTAMEHAQ